MGRGLIIVVFGSVLSCPPVALPTLLLGEEGWRLVAAERGMDDDVIAVFLAGLGKAECRCRGKGRGAGWAETAPVLQQPLQSATEAKDHQVETTMGLGVAMQQRGLGPNGSTVAARISAYEKGLASLSAKVQNDLIPRPRWSDLEALPGCEKSETEEALREFVEMQQRGWPPEVTTYKPCISACEKEDIVLHTGMQTTGLEPSGIPYAALISACDTISACGTESACGSALSSACEKGKDIMLHADMQKPGLEPNGVTYTALISACDISACDTISGCDSALSSACEKGRDIELHADMQTTGLEPSGIAYAALSSACGISACDTISACDSASSACEKGRDIELHADMQTTGEEPEEANISAGEKDHKVEATELCAEAQLRNLTPAIDCEKGDKAEKARKPIADTQVISACEKGHKKKKKKKRSLDTTAMELSTEMQQRNLNPEAIPYTAPISACEMIQVGVQDMELHADSQQALTPGANAYESISACDKGDKVEKAMEMSAEVQQSAYEKNHKGEKAGLHGEMQQAGLTPKEYTALIWACGHEVEKAIDLLAEMQQRGLAPAVGTYIGLLSSCFKGHEAEKTMALYVERPQGKRSEDPKAHALMHELYQYRRRQD